MLELHMQKLNFKPRLPWALSIALPLVGLSLFVYCFLTYLEAGGYLTPASVSVSGYHRRDGTYVQPYHRRPPGGVPHDAPYETTRAYYQAGMFLGVVVSLVPLFPSVLNSLQARQKSRRWIVRYKRKRRY
jgi:hypothetical protein